MYPELRCVAISNITYQQEGFNSVGRVKNDLCVCVTVCIPVYLSLSLCPLRVVKQHVKAMLTRQRSEGWTERLASVCGLCVIPFHLSFWRRTDLG